jgi:Domain of unknown function (DUF4062)
MKNESDPMSTPGSRQILTVFIGSPGDLEKERAIAREITDDVNKVLREIGWETELRGWEDTLPGHGRPQEIINADVRDCQLFLGLLHTRWGTPTGRFSSGFEEEFRVAMESRKSCGTPEIWLFFKRVNDEQRQDPGEQLSKVLDFRKEVEHSREVLFKEVKNTAEWKTLISSLILQFVLRKYKAQQVAADGINSAPARSADADVDTNSDGEIGRRDLPSQLKTIITQASQSAGENLDAFQAARLVLFSTAAVARHQHAVVNTHEINLLFRSRASLDLLQSEQNVLFSTLVSQSWDTIPGW